MSNTQIISKKLHVSSASDFIDSVKTDDAYYVFAAKHTQYASGDSPVPTPTDSVQNNFISIYDDMLYGKRVATSDIVPMIPRYDWTSGTTYAMYDDTDSALQTKQFYAISNTGSQYHVYKCLYNDANTASTEEPTGTDNDAFETADGYIWKYMYSANSFIEGKFSTTTHFPVTANTSVTGNAVPGSIEVINVDDGGAGYRNYLLSSFPASPKISDLVYDLGAAASDDNDFYNNCLLKVTSGAAQDEYKVITDYVVESGKYKATLDAAFTNTIVAGDTFEIYPHVDIFDTGGRKTINAVARAIVSNASSNAVSTVEVIAPGAGYRAATAVIRPAGAVGVSANASLRPIMSPADGHGAHVEDELGANYAGISIEFVQNEGVAPELLTDNDFRQIGLLKNPLFANVEITFSSGNTIGTFVANENVLQYDRKQLAGTVNTASNTTITGNQTVFEDWLAAGDRILITDGSSNWYGNVSSVTSNTQIVIDSNTSFTTDECNIYSINAVSYGIVSSVSSGTIYVANVNVATTTTSTRFVGESSFTTTISDTIKISRGGSTPDVRVTNNFYTFSQLTKLAGTIDDGVFTEDEFVTQDSALTYDQPSARVYAAIEDGATDYLYVTNVRNTFTNNVASGNTSDAQFTVTNKYEGELIPGSGEVVYIENLSPISRSNTQTETVKLILEF